MVLMVGLLVLLAACSQSTDQPEGEQLTIGIIQYVEHPSLDAARDGFIKALEDAGYKDGENITIDLQNAQAQQSNNKTIAQKFVADKVDLVLAIATPSAQAIVNETDEIPILFTAITDPLGAKLVSDLEKPGGNVTGTSDTHPDAIKNTMESIAKLFPDAKNVGIIYNDGEQNSVVNVENAKKHLDELGLTPVEATVSNSSEVKQAADSLVGRADVIYVPKDNTTVSALESVIQVANEQDIPLFVGEADSVRKGGFAGYGFEYEDLGYATGEMALQIIEEGKKPGDIPVAFPENLDLVINVKAAEEQGINLDELPQDILENAVRIGE
ncbi:MAG: ABC transporter substrate-binding protein [Bacillaceae bacterium]|nr:ABC transporter substrate-binding protein [Bacillaceae bacterium]